MQWNAWSVSHGSDRYSDTGIQYVFVGWNIFEGNGWWALWLRLKSNFTATLHCQLPVANGNDEQAYVWSMVLTEYGLKTYSLSKLVEPILFHVVYYLCIYFGRVIISSNHLKSDYHFAVRNTKVKQFY